MKNRQLFGGMAEMIGVAAVAGSVYWLTSLTGFLVMVGGIVTALTGRWLSSQRC